MTAAALNGFARSVALARRPGAAAVAIYPPLVKAGRSAASSGKDSAPELSPGQLTAESQEGSQLPWVFLPWPRPPRIPDSVSWAPTPSRVCLSFHSRNSPGLPFPTLLFVSICWQVLQGLHLAEPAEAQTLAVPSRARRLLPPRHTMGSETSPSQPPRLEGEGCHQRRSSNSCLLF